MLSRLIDAFEDIDQGLITCLHIFRFLVAPNVTRNEVEIRRETLTDRRIPIPQKTAFAGGNTWGIESSGIQNE